MVAHYKRATVSNSLFSRRSLQKSNRERFVPVDLFQERIAISLFRLQYVKSDSLEKPKSEFPTLQKHDKFIEKSWSRIELWQGYF